ncbi:MAG: hypothetical protein U0931_06765 [Vulcanimicrobiota bacterium]
MDNAPTSGCWSGFYRYGWLLLWRKERMTLNLVFKQGRIEGSGTDPVGAFEITGYYERDFHFTKKYSGKHSVVYHGQPQNGGLAGRWQIPNDWGGTFAIWPSGEEDFPTDLLGLPAN